MDSELKDVNILLNKGKSLGVSLRCYNNLRDSLECIDIFNRENLDGDKIKCFSTKYSPHMEELTVTSVSDTILKLTDELLEVNKVLEEMKEEKKERITKKGK